MSRELSLALLVLASCGSPDAPTETGGGPPVAVEGRAGPGLGLAERTARLEQLRFHPLADSWTAHNASHAITGTVGPDGVMDLVGIDWSATVELRGVGVPTLRENPAHLTRLDLVRPTVTE